MPPLPRSRLPIPALPTAKIAGLQFTLSQGPVPERNLPQHFFEPEEFAGGLWSLKRVRRAGPGRCCPPSTAGCGDGAARALSN